MNDVIELAQHLRKTSLAIEKVINNTLKADFGIDFTDWIILLNLKEGAKTQAQLAKILSFTGAGTTNAIDKLEKQNILVRVSNDNDRRKKYIELTKIGSLLTKSIEQRTKSILAVILGVVEDQTKLLASLEQIQVKIAETQHQ